MLKKFVLAPPVVLAFLYAVGPVTFPSLNSGETKAVWYTAFLTLVSAMYLLAAIGWPAATLNVLKREKPDISEVSNNKGFVFLGIFIVGFVISIVSILLSETGIADPFRQIDSDLKGMIGMVFVFFLLTFFWSVSSAIVAAEKQDSATTMRKVAGFLGIFYFFIGIFFLSPRLKRILSAD